MQRFSNVKDSQDSFVRSNSLSFIRSNLLSFILPIAYVDMLLFDNKPFSNQLILSQWIITMVSLVAF